MRAHLRGARLRIVEKGNGSPRAASQADGCEFRGAGGARAAGNSAHHVRLRIRATTGEKGDLPGPRQADRPYAADVCLRLGRTGPPCGELVGSGETLRGWRRLPRLQTVESRFLLSAGAQPQVRLRLQPGGVGRTCGRGWGSCQHRGPFREQSRLERGRRATRLACKAAAHGGRCFHISRRPRKMAAAQRAVRPRVETTASRLSGAQTPQRHEGWQHPVGSVAPASRRQPPRRRRYGLPRGATGRSPLQAPRCAGECPGRPRRLRR